jgi:hypothetical protein
MWAGQLEALALAARERGEGLAEPDIAQPDVGQRGEDLVRRPGSSPGPGRRRRRLERLGDRQVEHLGDVLAHRSR